MDLWNVKAKVTTLMHIILTYRIAMGMIELYIWYLWPLSEPTIGMKSDERAETSKATVVCATQNKDDALFTAIDTWCANHPAAVIIVASPGCAPWIQERARNLQYTIPIHVIEHSETHKRRQLCTGFKVVRTEYIVICDDDTRWTTGVLENLLQPLLTREDLGCVFPDLRVDPVGKEFTIWELLGLLRHVGDGVDFHASLHVDGGVFCHHGSTAAYRASILQDIKFVDTFTNDCWRGHLLNSGDDQFLCRWLVNNNWKVALCSAEMCLVQTRSRASWRHMLQLLRWSRNDFRSSFAGLLWEKKMWKRTPFTAWLRIVWMLRALAPFIELPYVCSNPSWRTAFQVLSSRMIRYTPYFIEHPLQLWLVPVFLLHLYSHGFLKLYAFCTLTNTSWI